MNRFVVWFVGMVSLVELYLRFGFGVMKEGCSEYDRWVCYEI